jgi:predicted N-acetyltransferase YhbS
MGNVTPHPSIAGGPLLRPPEPLREDHLLAGFDCGKPDLNRWLLERGRKSEGRTSRTFVACADRHVVGYYCLSTGAVIRDALPRSLRRNTPDAVPVFVMGRLAVDLRHQGKGFGKGLVRDAILRTLSVSTEVGSLALIVHVIDDSAIPFYKKYSFVPSPSNARTFILPLETARQAV